MSERSLGAASSIKHGNDGAISITPHEIEPANRTDALTKFEREQLARDIADIERATVALRRAAPALQSWAESNPAAQPKPRPVWLLVSLLWLSTALVTAAAIAAIALLAA